MLMIIMLLLQLYYMLLVENVCRIRKLQGVFCDD